MADMDEREAYFDSLRDEPYQASYDLSPEEMGAPPTHCEICSEEFTGDEEEHPLCLAWDDGFETFRKRALNKLIKVKAGGGEIGDAYAIINAIT